MQLRQLEHMALDTVCTRCYTALSESEIWYLNAHIEFLLFVDTDIS